MHIDILPLVIVIILIILLTGIFTYFILKSNMVKRSKLDKVQNILHNTSTELFSLKTTQKELLARFETVQNQLEDEYQKNKIHEQKIAEINAYYMSLKDAHDTAIQTNTKHETTIEAKIDKINKLNKQLFKLEANHDTLQEQHEEHKSEMESARKQALLQFEHIANKLLEEKSTKFTKFNKESIESILKPLGENLKEFRKKVEETYDKESKQRFTLESKIKELVDLNQQISKDANNLTNALKGQAKTQGDWGEMILENILEYSGLVKDREYFVQHSFTDKKGKRKQPDIIVKYPDDRHVIIDAKVSLTAYERFANADDLDAQKIHLADHFKSIKTHIDNLSLKEYDAFDKSLDFVMLFVPIEPAYMTAIHYDQELWSYAYKKRVLLISPTNLIAALKMVSDIWKREHQNTNALKIAQRGEKLYEKFVGFVTDMDDIDKHITRLNNSYSNAMSKLTQGSGNLVGQAEKLKKLGVNSKKELPEKYRRINSEDK